MRDDLKNSPSRRGENRIGLYVGSREQRKLVLRKANIPPKKIKKSRRRAHRNRKSTVLSLIRASWIAINGKTAILKLNRKPTKKR